MRMTVRSLATALALLAPTVAASQQPGAAAAPAAPTAGPRAEALTNLGYYEQRYVSLAEQVPQDKYTWRPAEGVRSVAEVFLHVAGANYGLPRMMGAAPPASFVPRGFEASTTEKAKIVQSLKDSFAHIRSAVIAMPEADLDKQIRVFGMEMTQRAFLTFLIRHLGEHLGQSIAYARVNGVVPPWSEGR